MEKIRKSNGNNYVDITLNDNQIDESDMEHLLKFIECHDNIYLFGEGLCGNGMAEYLSVCGFGNIRGFVTSATFEEKMKQYQKGTDGIILSLKAEYYSEILPMILSKVSIDDILFLKERSKQIFVQTFSGDYFRNHFWITLPLALHCNINCTSCNMFSPLCGKEVYTLDSVKEDVARLKQAGINPVRINISGGEPFLNPEIVEILQYIRAEFCEQKIDLYTNGLLVNNLSDEQLKAILKCNLEFQITEYGIHQEILDNLYKRFEKIGMAFVINRTDEQKLFYKKVIDFDKQVSVYDYINCQYYTFAFSVFMYNGKLFKCPMAMNVDKINQYSKKKLEITDEDYLELDHLKSEEQLYGYWKNRMQMCGYCPRVTEAFQWKKSERKIEEWMATK